MTKQKVNSEMDSKWNDTAKIRCIDSSDFHHYPILLLKNLPFLSQHYKESDSFSIIPYSWPQLDEVYKILTVRINQK